MNKKFNIEIEDGVLIDLDNDDVISDNPEWILECFIAINNNFTQLMKQKELEDKRKKQYETSR